MQRGRDAGEEAEVDDRLCGARSSAHGTEEHLEAALPALPAYASVASRFVLAGSRCVWVVSEAEAWAIRFRAGM